VKLLRWIDVHVLRARECSSCGCTDHFACTIGDRRCTWSIGQWFAGANVCSFCVAADLERPAL
jgi:hypothetical protein